MSLVGMWAVGMKSRDIGKVGKIVGLQGRKDLYLMEGFEKGLGGHAWPCKGGKDGVKVLVMLRLEKGSRATSWRIGSLPFPALYFCFLLKPRFLQLYFSTQFTLFQSLQNEAPMDCPSLRSSPNFLLPYFSLKLPYHPSP